MWQGYFLHGSLMSYRGSFSKCVSAMGILFGQERYKTLFIVDCETGKYYTLYTPDEYERHRLTPFGQRDRTVLNITRKELRLLYEYTQKDLFRQWAWRKLYLTQNRGWESLLSHSSPNFLNFRRQIGSTDPRCRIRCWRYICFQSRNPEPRLSAGSNPATKKKTNLVSFNPYYNRHRPYLIHWYSPRA